MGRGYDESDVKGVLIVTLEDMAQAKFVPLGLPCFYDLQTTVDGLADVLPAAGSEDYYRITLTGESEPLDLVQLRKQYARFSNLELQDATVLPLDIWGNAEDDTLEGAFFRILRQHEDEDLAERAARIARQLLDGQEVELL